MGKVAATKTFRMALIDQQEKAKGISNSPKSYSLTSISGGLQALVGLCTPAWTSQKNQSLVTHDANHYPGEISDKGYRVLPVNRLAPIHIVK